MTTDAYTAGRKIATQRLPASLNPHADGTTEAVEWFRGWQEGLAAANAPIVARARREWWAASAQYDMDWIARGGRH